MIVLGIIARKQKQSYIELNWIEYFRALSLFVLLPA